MNIPPLNLATSDNDRDSNGSGDPGRHFATALPTPPPSARSSSPRKHRVTDENLRRNALLLSRLADLSLAEDSSDEEGRMVRQFGRNGVEDRWQGESKCNFSLSNEGKDESHWVGTRMASDEYKESKCEGKTEAYRTTKRQVRFSDKNEIIPSGSEDRAAPQEPVRLRYHPKLF